MIERLDFVGNSIRNRLSARSPPSGSAAWRRSAFRAPRPPASSTPASPRAARPSTSQDTVVRNETATFFGSAPDSCRVELAAGVDLTLVNVTIKAEKYLSFSGPATASLSIRRSDLGACDSDVSSLVIYKSKLKDPAGGCNGKELEISGDIKIIDSTLTATQSLGYTQIFSSAGNVRVFKSVLLAGTSVEIGVFSDAKVASVCRNDITTGHTAISSGGKTAVRHNDISGTSSLSGFPCISIGNSPGVVCGSTCRGLRC